MLVNIDITTLFQVILVTAFATSQPYQTASASRRNDFEWNTRKIGTKKVATISIRKEEERDRRSIVIAESDDGVLGVKTSSRHHHLHPETPPESDKRGKSSYHYHRHHRGEGIYPDIYTDGMIGRSEYHSEAFAPLEDSLIESDILYSDELEQDDLSSIDESLMNSRKLQELLSTVGLDINAEVFRNVTQMIDQLRRKKEVRKTEHKKKKRSKKVKRDRRRKGKKKKRDRKKKCKHLKGKQKKRCRSQSRQRPTFTSISMSGSEACQYHNLEECSRKVGFLELPHESMLTVVKCRYREQFFDCMEELRLESCDPNFQTEGDMKALRMQIRQAIHTTNSCLISEVVEG